MAGYDIDLRQIVALNMYMLHIFGIIPANLDSAGTLIIYVLKIIVVMGFFSGGVMLSQVINMLLSFGVGDVGTMVTSTYLTLTNTFVVAKCYVIYKYRNKIQSLIDTINRKEFQPKSIVQYDILKNNIRLAKIITFFLLVSALSTCCVWGIYPYVADEGPFLPLATYIPFKTDSSPVFEIVYTYEMIGICISATACSIIDSLTSGLIIVVAAELTVLNDSLKKIREFAEADVKVNSNTTDEITQQTLKVMEEKLIDCVAQHKQILEFANDLSHIFSKVIFGQFFATVVILCTTLFEITTVSWTSLKFLSLLLYQSCMLMEIFSLCYFGDQVIFQSLELTSSAYQSDWVPCTKIYKHNLLFFMTNTQIRMEFSAGGFVTLSLETFGNILKSSFSYFTVLNQLNSEDI